jgi:hypothetical protein
MPFGLKNVGATY